MKMPQLGLYARFFFLFSITTAILALCIAIGVANISEDDAKEFVKERHQKLNELMLGAIAKPIALENIKEKFKTPNVELLITKGNERYTTDDDFPEMSVLFQKAEAIESVYFVKHQSKYFLIAVQGEEKIAVTSRLLNWLIYPNWLITWPFFAALFVLCMSYWLLKKLLHPVESATYCAKMVSKGRFDYRIEKHSKTELAELTHGLNTMTEKLQRLFESKNELLLAISHELRTPLARMKVSLAMIEHTENTADLHDDIHQIDTLIEQLLEGERLQHDHKALHLSSYFVPTLIDDVINEPDINGKIQLQGDVPEQVVNIDVGRIKFLLRNLLKNAIDHSPENTEIFFSISQGNEQLKFAVQDHGSGIPKAALEHIFDPFYCVENTSHRDTRGTGLGLYLSQRIAKAHKGQLQVTSEQGKGSVFTLILPIEKA